MLSHVTLPLKVHALNSNSYRPNMIRAMSMHKDYFNSSGVFFFTLTWTFMHINGYNTKCPIYIINVNTYMERIIILVGFNVYKCQCLECGDNITLLGFY